MYPMVMNHGEGHRLFLEDDAAGRFRITATKGTHVKGNLRGSPGHFNRLETAFNSCRLSPRPQGATEGSE